jgi:hypothetical protein
MEMLRRGHQCLVSDLFPDRPGAALGSVVAAHSGVQRTERIENKKLSYRALRRQDDVMRRDPDLIRAILLAVEASDGWETIRIGPIAGHPPTTVRAHVGLLVEAGLLRSPFDMPRAGRDWLILRLSWAGHDFLDQIRDPKIWRTTKAGAKRLGSWSVETIGALAKAALLAKAAELGLVIAIDRAA